MNNLHIRIVGGGEEGKSAAVSELLGGPRSCPGDVCDPSPGATGGQLQRTVRNRPTTTYWPAHSEDNDSSFEGGTRVSSYPSRNTWRSKIHHEEAGPGTLSQGCQRNFLGRPIRQPRATGGS